MNKVESIRKIEPRQVAEKLDAVANFLLPEVQRQIEENPRLADAMWFLSWVSQPDNYAGGLARFAADFIESCKSEIGPACLIEKGKRDLTRPEVEEILGCMPWRIVETFLRNSPERGKMPAEAGDEASWTEEAYSREQAQRLLFKKQDPRQPEYSESLPDQTLKRLTYDKLHALCIFAAESHLAEFLHGVCSDPETGFYGRKIYPSVYSDNQKTSHNSLWYFPNLWVSLFAWLDLRAEKVRETIAETSVSKTVFHWLRLAEESRKGVMMIGNSRHGKTEAIRTYARMHPWRVRIIETPHSMAEGDLLREIARALGISFNPMKVTSHNLRATVDFVLRQSNLMLIFDEAQFLFPTNGRRSDPPRLNYVRRAIMDIGLPVVFVCTPQSWKRVEKGYLKTSGFSIEQFEGRLLRSAVILPDELSPEELIEVARIHFPDLKDDYLAYIAKIVGGFTGPILSCFENVSRLARVFAREAGREKLTLADIKEALSNVLPSSPEGSVPAEKQRAIEPPLTAVQPPIKRGLTPIGMNPPGRAIRPASTQLVPAGD